jgi:hypothetical protein
MSTSLFNSKNNLRDMIIIDEEEPSRQERKEDKKKSPQRHPSSVADYCGGWTENAEKIPLMTQMTRIRKIHHGEKELTVGG